jgi:hypothetical protein
VGRVNEELQWVLPQFETPKELVIPKRGIVARGICCFAAGSKQIPRR